MYILDIKLLGQDFKQNKVYPNLKQLVAAHGKLSKKQTNIKNKTKNKKNIQTKCWLVLQLYTA